MQNYQKPMKDEHMTFILRYVDLSLKLEISSPRYAAGKYWSIMNYLNDKLKWYSLLNIFRLVSFGPIFIYNF